MRYAGFKTEILNGLTLKAIEQPENLNTMYLLANQWVKPVPRGNATGFASAFTTTLTALNGHAAISEEGKEEKTERRKAMSSSNNIQAVVEH
jgi:hypothetical protein